MTSIVNPEPALPAVERADRCAARRSLRALGGVARGLLGAGLLLGACTLTNDDFEPSLVGRGQLLPDGGAPAPTAPCATGAECCATRPCPGSGVCQAGVCKVPAPSADAGASRCEGTDCSNTPPLVRAPSCDDARQNGDEAGVDCGGSCPRACGAAANGCGDGRQSGDETGVDCGGACPPCAPPTCDDSVQNGDESAADCGGGDCDPCGVGERCRDAGDCASGVCRAGACAAPSCGDGARNGDETGVDCGGSCAPGCGVGAGCLVASDCGSGVCDGPCAGGVELCCQAPSCQDGVQNGGEPSLDCGNGACGPCPLGRPCAADVVCASGFCAQGVCSDPGSCFDGVQNGRETGPDCGGGTCQRCRDLLGCDQPSDCFNNNCDSRGVCISCGDNVIDGTETGVDCGGADPFCRRCNPGERCIVNSDCADGTCFGGFC